MSKNPLLGERARAIDPYCQRKQALYHGLNSAINRVVAQ
jgi:hypothetical protein